ncbi:mitochondrial import inner membrane translocase subunit TIM16-like [Eubalaena glacialis]|uniref:mitochondrial import inner membrane translocase subunit TIM16-like n=1 Tax=Eubalaena glacialis TaxID=27606 RepID=UPI002A5AE98C|nr:mitochondrial import inner membrane translocase subunit TIM16-like [Eubalaena glacialis]
MWDPPNPKLEPASAALAGGFPTTAPPGKSSNSVILDQLPLTFAPPAALEPGPAGPGSRSPCPRSRTAAVAKYLAQIIVIGVQVVGRDFARALRQEFTASQAAADAQGRARHQSAAASNLSGLSLQKTQQILNVFKLSPEETQKNYEHLFKVNDKSVGASFYLLSKVVRAKERLEEQLRIQAQEDRE